MISEPNCESPANVDASKELRDDKEDYNKKIKKIVELANKALPSDFEMPDSLKVGEEEVEKEEKYELLFFLRRCSLNSFFVLKRKPQQTQIL